jgi:hypothetical protein
MTNGIKGEIAHMMQLRLLGTSLMVVFILSATASAQVQVRVFVNSTGPGSDLDTTVVEVPSDWSIVGGGATTNWVLPQPGQLLTSSYPLDEHHWVATSKAHSVSFPAMLSAFAIAIHNPGGKLYDVKIFAQRSTSNADISAISASVDAGYAMTGGGAQTLTAGVGQLLTASYPASESTWTANSKAHTVSSAGDIVAYAIGVKSKTGQAFPRVTRLAGAASAPGEYPQNTLNVAASFILTGGGALVQYSSQVGCLLTGSVPVGSFGWFGQAKDHTTADGTCTMTVYALGIPGAVLAY